ncbi:hypothetical protein ACFZCL_04015 [Streptomyces sp. NPDC008159]|uniref:hypothetical protein n=1 Tax=Streptomyces sp. NPDC008159 TaxID=3364817 RepID=UPI0036E92979
MTVETRDNTETGSASQWCAWHQGYTRTARPVRDPADQGSGAGAPTLYACAPCRYALDLVPLGERL